MFGWKDAQEWSNAVGGRARSIIDKSRHEAHRYTNRISACVITAPERMIGKLRETRGQGTTEYAILVGVLVVIAIIAVVAFREKLQSLWESISSGINSL